MAQRFGRRLAFQMLIYPALDLTWSTTSRVTLGHGFLLDRPLLDWFERCYLGEDRLGKLALPQVSPGLAPNLQNLPPAYIAVAGFDPLRDEGEAYAARLLEAGTPVELVHERALVHGFFNMSGVVRRAREAVLRAAAALRAGLRREVHAEM
jgi:acetyl esterase